MPDKIHINYFKIKWKRIVMVSFEHDWLIDMTDWLTDQVLIVLANCCTSAWREPEKIKETENEIITFIWTNVTLFIPTLTATINLYPTNKYNNKDMADTLIHDINCLCFITELLDSKSLTYSKPERLSKDWPFLLSWIYSVNRREKNYLVSHWAILLNAYLEFFSWSLW